MLRLAVIVCALLFWRQASAQVGQLGGTRVEITPARDFHVVSSTSGLFVIHDLRPAGTQPIRLLAGMERDYVRLDGRFLAVSCERVRAALLKELGAPNQWSGKIHIFLHEARSLDETIVLGSAISSGNWTYNVAMPDTVEKGRLTAALVGVNLWELANRGADRPAEIPTWLTQGLARELMAASRMGLLVSAPSEGNQSIQMSSQLFDGTNALPMQLAYEELQMRPPLTLEQLTWPPPDFVENEVYRSSAQLMVYDLLQLKDGRASLCAFIRKLPLYLNWQMAFLDAFHAQFASQLDVDKWWTLCVANFTGRDLARVWPYSESWHKLDEILHTGVEVRTGVDQLPLQTDMPLQRIIAEWGFATQQGVLKTKIQQLSAFRNWVSQDLVGTVDDYRQVLQAYLRGRERTGFFRTTLAQRFLGSDPDAKQTIQQLDYLDQRREYMRPTAPVANSVASANTPVNH